MHVARYVIISLSFLFYLSQSVWHFFPHIFSSIVTLFVVLCCGHTVAHHIYFFCLFRFVPFTFHYHYSVLCPFLPLLSVSLSVMAYQDGFYGAADLYVSIYLNSTASLLFSPCCLWVFKCKMAKNKPIEMFTFQVFAFSTFGHLLLTLMKAFIPFKDAKFECMWCANGPFCNP